MKKTIFTIATVLLSSIIFFATLSDTKVEAANIDDEFPCAYSFSDIYYGSDSITTLSSDEAQANNIPSGYSDNVLVVEGQNANRGILLDFSEEKIPTTILKSITFRVYVSDDGISTNTYPEIRIPDPNALGQGWLMRYLASDLADQWINVTLTSQFEAISKNGYLDKFELAVRNAAYGPYYIDSVTVSLKEDDGVGPIIEYTGTETVYLYENIDKFEVTAYDEFEKRSIPVECVWPQGSELNSNGVPAPGSYDLLLRAVDFYGNITEESVNVIVREADEQAPVIDVNTESIYAVTGTIPMLKALVNDNSAQKIDVTYTWSSGALDVFGKLVKGTHTWTVTAVDQAGNKAEKLVTVYVDDEERLGNNVIDEQVLSLEASGSHKLVLIPRVEPTVDKEGNIEYYYCEHCDKYYSDKSGTKEIAREDTIISKLKEDENTTNKDNSSTAKDNSIMTGDNALVTMHFCLLVVACCAIVLLLVRRKGGVRK